MTCHHGPNDPNCSSSPAGRARAEADAARYREEQRKREQAELMARTPNPDDFEVIRVEEVGAHLVMEVRYSSCTKCSFDAKKVMVFFNTSLKQAILWRRIDPHFTDKPPKSPKEAPTPRARFPADNIGWTDALTYARNKTGK